MHIYNETDEIATLPLSKPLPYPLNLVTTTQTHTQKLPYKKQARIVRRETLPELDRESAVIYQKKALRDSAELTSKKTNRPRFRKPQTHTIETHTGSNLGKTLALLRAGKKIKIYR